jgi:hypothetical protein
MPERLPPRAKGKRTRMVDHALALAHQTGIRLAEFGYLLIIFAGGWFVAAEVPRLGRAFRKMFGGLALAAGGLLLLIATHWGHFG